jgi:transposase-like protein
VLRGALRAHPGATRGLASYRRELGTQASEVELKIPKLRQQTFERAIIERARTA